MFKHKTFESILEAMMLRVPDDVDKQEGSIIFDALAPSAMELAEIYSDMDLVMSLSFADTADGDYLRRRVAEHGVFWEDATQAVREITVTDSLGAPHDAVPVGSRFSLNQKAYTVTEKLAAGSYSALANEPGSQGNRDFGALLAIESLDGLGAVELGDVLVPGQDEETDEDLYERFLRHINEQPFGGNRADYKKKVLSLEGTGGVRLFRAHQGGGTVKVVLIDSEFNAPSAELIKRVQTTLDPEPIHGDGLGLAPIGHVVLVEGVKTVEVNFVTTLVLDSVTKGQVKPLVEEKIKEYLSTLRKDWGDREDDTFVRVSRLESRLLDIVGIVDVIDTKINGVAGNLLIPKDSIPTLGSVVLNGE